MKKLSTTLLTVFWMSSLMAGNIDKHTIPVFKGEKLSVKIETAPSYGCKQTLKINRQMDTIEVSKNIESENIPCDFPFHTTSEIKFELTNEWAMDYDIELLVPEGSNVELDR